MIKLFYQLIFNINHLYLLGLVILQNFFQSYFNLLIIIANLNLFNNHILFLFFQSF